MLRTRSGRVALIPPWPEPAAAGVWVPSAYWPRIRRRRITRSATASASLEQPGVSRHGGSLSGPLDTRPGRERVLPGGRDPSWSGSSTANSISLIKCGPDRGGDRQPGGRPIAGFEVHPDPRIRTSQAVDCSWPRGSLRCGPAERCGQPLPCGFGGAAAGINVKRLEEAARSDLLASP